jgi:hypothetical protein
VKMQVGLEQSVKLWPTPASRDWRDDGNCPSAQSRKSPCLPAAAYTAGPPAPENPSTSGKPRGSLNCRWVAQLMGYPPDWCDLPTEVLSRLTETRSYRPSSKSSAA